ncbi:NAD(P)/FAD-dependent oxidoreductase [Aureimonas populi]|uniref:NAD(P)/FAD-dependent oxidoreductase n=1 Tax=Aureimonas populi TaxID=1701758 RepID=A0ABW5CP70_9HYPH|nr:FAD-dependent oxidoreductase [Aureimonas populi]
MRIAVIGTGIVGVCSAAFLQEDGHEIVFLDPREAGEACSFGNAGSLSPSACLPVGMPGAWRNVPGWLLDPDGPLVIRARHLPKVLPWLMRFLRASSETEVRRIAAALRSLLQPVFECYEPLIERAGARALVRRNGCLYVYSSRRSADRWRWGMNLRRELGVEMREVGEAELAELEPDLRGRFRFGQFAPDNGSTSDPSALVKAIYGQAIEDGATHRRASVVDFERHAGEIRGIVLDDGERLAADAVVIAAGAWSGRLARKVGARVPLESQRGYHVTVEDPTVKLNRTVMAVEHNMMINPMTAGLRLAGTVEFAGLAAEPRYARSRVLLEKGRELFPGLKGSRNSYWMGHRPCLPDSLPVIGAAPGADNVFFGFGHGHVGMCAGATTGREIAHLVSGRRPAIDLSPFSPTRF